MISDTLYSETANYLEPVIMLGRSDLKLEGLIYIADLLDRFTFSEYRVLRDLYEEGFDVKLLIYGPRAVAELALTEFRPKIPTYWSPELGALKHRYLSKSALTFWKDNKLKHIIYPPLPEPEELIRLVEKSGYSLRTGPRKILKLGGLSTVVDVAYDTRTKLILVLLEGPARLVGLDSISENIVLTVKLDLCSPSRLYLYNGTVYVLDRLSAEVVLVSLDEARVISRLALTPPCLCLARSEQSYLPELVYGSVFEFRTSDGDELCGTGRFGNRDGKAKSAQLSFPMDCSVDGINLFFIDTLNYSIRRINLVTGELRTILRYRIALRDLLCTRLILKDSEAILLAKSKHKIIKADLKTKEIEDLRSELRGITLISRIGQLDRFVASDGVRIYMMELEGDELKVFKTFQV